MCSIVLTHKFTNVQISIKYFFFGLSHKKLLHLGGWVQAIIHLIPKKGKLLNADRCITGRFRSLERFVNSAVLSPQMGVFGTSKKN